MVKSVTYASARTADKSKQTAEEKDSDRINHMDINTIMQQAKAMQEKMAKIQQDLAKKTISGSAGGGMVQVTVNGQGEVLSTSIEKAVVDVEEIEMLQDLIVAATNDALRKAKELSKNELAQLTGGLNLPGLSQFMQP